MKQLIRFGTAGTPWRVKKGGSLAGIQCVHDLKLRAFEFEFVRGVKMKPALAKQCGDLAKKLDVKLSAHGPYYVNLVSEKKNIRGFSKHNVMETARVLHAAGGGRVVFHPGYYGKLSAKDAFNEMLGIFKDLVKRVKTEKLNVVIGPETTGKASQFGSVEELCDLAAKIKEINPTFDWAHIHGREGKGRFKKKEDYAIVLKLIKKKLGPTRFKNLHCHFTNIEFSAKGEVRHHDFGEGYGPDFKPLAELLKEQKAGGTIISEFPSIEDAALKMQKIYKTA